MNNLATVNDYRWLAEGDGQKWLSEVANWELPLHTMAGRLRAQLTSVQSHLVLEQHALRQRARHRFPRANEMFFTSRALEQATDERIAIYKAHRFPLDRPRADCCCGIGGDLLALGQGEDTVGYEQDSIVAYLAAVNCERLLRRRCRVIEADITRLRLSPDWAVHVDPDRRPRQRRSVQLDHHQPPRAFLEPLVRTQPFGALKLAPATSPEDPLLRDAQLEWIGHGRECLQLVAWFGQAAEQTGGRVATLLDPQGGHSSLAAARPAPLEIASEVGPVLVEPHAVLLAAGLTGILAEQLHLQALTARGGYLTGTTCVPHPMATIYDVLEATVFRRRHLRRLVEKHQIGQLEVKVRGVAAHPEEVRRSLLHEGPEAGVLLLARVANRQVAILAQRRPATRSMGPDRRAGRG